MPSRVSNFSSSKVPTASSNICPLLFFLAFVSSPTSVPTRYEYKSSMLLNKSNKPVLIEKSTISSTSKLFFEKLTFFEDLVFKLKIGTFYS